MLKNYFVKVSRNILNTPYYKDPSLLKAWMGLVLSVRFQPYVFDGIEVGVDEVLLTKKELSELFGTERRRTFTILKRMERDGLIEFGNIRNKYTLIKILKADFSFSDKKKTQRGGREEKNLNSERDILYENRNSGEAAMQEEAYEKTAEAYENPSVHTEKEIKKETQKEPSADIRITKSAYGEFNNVFLTEDEYDSLINKFSEAGIFIEKLSSYLASAPGKKYPNHYAVILSWYSDYLLKNNNKAKNSTYAEKSSGMNRTKEEAAEPDPTASYDIRRAEMRARMNVPVLKERNRETGEWEPVKREENRNTG